METMLTLIALLLGGVVAFFVACGLIAIAAVVLYHVVRFTVFVVGSFIVALTR